LGGAHRRGALHVFYLPAAHYIMRYG
jgi:hypothetical protein